MTTTITDHAPFRADQVGSLLRPPELKTAREQRAKGEIIGGGSARHRGPAHPDGGQDAGSRRIPGDHRRRFSPPVVVVGLPCAIEGVVQRPRRRAPRSKKRRRSAAWCGTGSRRRRKSRRQARMAGWRHSRQGFEFLKSLTTRTPKVTIPSPSMLHFRGGRGGVDQTAYPDMEQFFADLIAVYRARSWIWPRPAVAMFSSMTPTSPICAIPGCAIASKASARTRTSLPHLYARLINGAIAGRPRDMKITVHLCRGNSLSRGHAEGGYEPVAEAMFNELKVDGFFLEYDDARSGDFAPLRFVPKGDLRIVLGVITSKFGELEPKDADQAPHRGGRKIHAVGADVPVCPMRLCQPHGRQSPVRRAAVREAAPCRRDRRRDVAPQVKACPRNDSYACGQVAVSLSFSQR